MAATPLRPSRVVTDFAPALLTAIHLALAMLRRHRSHAAVLSPFVLPSMLFPAAPWLWPSPTGLAVALAVHACWLVVCEIAAPPPLPSPRKSQGAAPAAAPVSSSSTARAAPRKIPQSSSGAFAPTPVLAVLDEADDIKTFRLLRPDGYEFVAGQFVPVRVRVDGKPHVRCYSISSSPDSRGYLEISVRRQGLVSTLLHATVQRGATVALGRPAGTFVYPADDDRPITLLAGGVGITPLLSMLRYAVSSDPSRPVTLLYSARSEQHLAFLSELRLLAERHPAVRIGITLTRPASATSWRTGRIDASMLRQHVPHPAHSIFCICGPAPMIGDSERLLQEFGVQADQIRSERFDLGAAAAVLVPSNSPSLETPARAAEPRMVTFAASGRQCEVPAARTLLEAAEAEGIAVPSSCRAGVCQACRTLLLDGSVDCRSDVLDPEDRAAGYILPCVSWVTTDCVLQA